MLHQERVESKLDAAIERLPSPPADADESEVDELSAPSDVDEMESPAELLEPVVPPPESPKSFMGMPVGMQVRARACVAACVFARLRVCVWYS